MKENNVRLSTTTSRASERAQEKWKQTDDGQPSGLRPVPSIFQNEINYWRGVQVQVVCIVDVNPISMSTTIEQKRKHQQVYHVQRFLFCWPNRLTACVCGCERERYRQPLAAFVGGMRDAPQTIAVVLACIFHWIIRWALFVRQPLELSIENVLTVVGGAMCLSAANATEIGILKSDRRNHVLRWKYIFHFNLTSTLSADGVSLRVRPLYVR